MHIVKGSIITVVLLISLMMQSSFAAEVSMELEYTSAEINQLLIQTHQEYPQNTELEIIGYTYLENPIYVLRLIGSQVSDYDSTKHKQPEINNYLILGGVHAREVVNPQLLLKQINYYLEGGGLDVNAVVHFIPLVNPDGYDLVLHGIGKPAGDYKLWKANLRGVDINRNFPSFYYSAKEGMWVDYWGRCDNGLVADKPGPSYYKGEYAGSEKETQAVMGYMNKYSFNLMVDYHSQGEVIFWGMWMMPAEYTKYNKKLADLVQSINGYKPYINYNDEHGSGYTTDYFATTQYAPAITVETTRAAALPYVSTNMRNTAFTKNKDTTKELVLFNEKNIPTGLGDTLLLNSRGGIQGSYPREFVAGYKERFNLHELNVESLTLVEVLGDSNLTQKEKDRLIESKVRTNYNLLPDALKLDLQAAKSNIKEEYGDLVKCLIPSDIISDKYHFEMDTPPIIYKDVTLVPVRALTEALGSELSWDESVQLVTITRGDKNIQLKVGDKLALVDSTEVEMLVAPVLVSSRVYVPLRFISETFGLKVYWNEDTNTIILE